MHRSRVLLPLLFTGAVASGMAQSPVETKPVIPLVPQPAINFRFQPAPKVKIADRALHFPVPVLNFEHDMAADSCYTMRSYHFQNDPNRPESPAFTGSDTCQSASEAQLRDTGVR